MTGFKDWIRFEPAPVAAFDHVAEFDALAHERLARDIERRVKTTLDPGIDPKRSAEISRLKVKTEGRTFVINTDDSNEALAFAESPLKSRPEQNEAHSVEELFSMSSGVPEVKNGRLVYKTIKLESLMGTQQQFEQDQQAKHAIEDTLRENLPNAYEEAFAEIDRRHPVVK